MCSLFRYGGRINMSIFGINSHVRWYTTFKRASFHSIFFVVPATGWLFFLSSHVACSKHFLRYPRETFISAVLADKNTALKQERTIFERKRPRNFGGKQAKKRKQTNNEPQPHKKQKQVINYLAKSVVHTHTSYNARRAHTHKHDAIHGTHI